MLRSVILPCAVLSIFALLLVGCATASVNRSEARAQEGAPESAQVELVEIPFDAALPRYVVAVDALDYSASGQISGGGQAAPMAAGMASTTFTTKQNPDGSITTTTGEVSAAPNIGKGISAQLTTALSHWGNVSIVDRAALVQNADGTYSCKLQPGEVGPFVIKGTVTEFAETADASGKTRKGGLGGVGLATGLVGAITGNSDVAAVGTGLAIANPNAAKADMKRKGMVGMDLQLVDGRTARIVRGYNCSGTFTTISSVSGMSVFGIGGTNTEFAASALGQATRAAMNDAVKQTAEALKTVR